MPKTDAATAPAPVPAAYLIKMNSNTIYLYQRCHLVSLFMPKPAKTLFRLLEGNEKRERQRVSGEKYLFFNINYLCITIVVVVVVVAENCNNYSTVIN